MPVTDGGRAACEARWARWGSVVLGNAKRAVSGCYHAVKQTKFARRYLVAVPYRFNRRVHLATMLSAAVACNVALQALSRADVARARQFSWLRFETDQTGLLTLKPRLFSIFSIGQWRVGNVDPRQQTCGKTCRKVANGVSSKRGQVHFPTRVGQSGSEPFPKASLSRLGRWAARTLAQRPIIASISR